jgi:hypothetical protein
MEARAMAKVVRYTWRSGSRKVRRVSWGYTLQINGKQERRADAAWTQEEAQQALAARLLERDTPAALPTQAAPSLAALAAEYLDFKRAKGKRSLADDETALARRILPWFGGEERRRH